MNEASVASKSTRREFIQQTSALAAGASVLGGALPAVHAADDHTIRLALIGCGHRGTGAVDNAMDVKNYGPVKLHAMADLNGATLGKVHDALKAKLGEKIDVADDRKFIGFDAYKKAIDCLRPGDIAMCTTRAYIRPTHVEYAVKKGINVFMEKPFATDPVGLRRLLRAGEEAEKKGVKIAAGFQCRHSPARQAMIQQVRDGKLGEIPLIRANRLGGTGWLKPQGEKGNTFLEQLQFGKVQLYWVGSGHMVDYLIHQIDECCWIKDAWPVNAIGMGGRVADSKDCGQNLDNYSIEYTFADGTKAFCGFYRINKARSDFATYIHGTKCAAQFSGNVHAPTVRRFKDHRIAEDNIAWEPPKDTASPWQYEWVDFITSIRNDLPYNECKRACYSDMTTIMGRAAVHTGQMVTWEEMMKSDFAFCKDPDALNENSTPPAIADATGQFTVPVVGQWKEV